MTEAKERAQARFAAHREAYSYVLGCNWRRVADWLTDDLREAYQDAARLERRLAETEERLERVRETVAGQRKELQLRDSADREVETYLKTKAEGLAVDAARWRAKAQANGAEVLRLKQELHALRQSAADQRRAFQSAEFALRQELQSVWRQLQDVQRAEALEKIQAQAVPFKSERDLKKAMGEAEGALPIGPLMAEVAARQKAFGETHTPPWGDPAKGEAKDAKEEPYDL